MKDSSSLSKRLAVSVRSRASLALAYRLFVNGDGVPTHRILQVEAVTKVRREKLRPDLYSPDVPFEQLDLLVRYLRQHLGIHGPFPTPSDDELLAGRGVGARARPALLVHRL
jgi:hypothetical protein